jgi:ABC-type phosphate transport system auxiliary subunit|tara:strand:- start:2596 stop:2961 length:366 start_codon:yes stop_codon:yes gene_type:complete
MTWDFYGDGEDFVLKEKKEKPKEILDSMDSKARKRLKKTLQAAEPTEFFGQDFTKLGELITVLRELDLTKSDKKLNKKMKSMDERNIDIVATATKLRKEYELLYRQLRDLVYPKGKGRDKR